MALLDKITEAVDSAKEALHSTSDELEKKDPENEPHGDAIALLREDHRRVEALFKEILADKSSALTGQRKNIERVVAELTLHAKIEETILYPAVYGKTKRDTDERLEVLEAYEEHGSIKDLLKRIQRSTGRDETLKAKVQVLSEITEHHVKEEESEFFPEAHKLLGEKRLKQIGDEIVKIKARAEKRNAPKPKRGAKAAARKSFAKAGRKK